MNLPQFATLTAVAHGRTGRYRTLADNLPQWLYLSQRELYLVVSQVSTSPDFLPRRGKTPKNSPVAPILTVARVVVGFSGGGK